MRYDIHAAKGKQDAEQLDGMVIRTSVSEDFVTGRYGADDGKRLLDGEIVCIHASTGPDAHQWLWLEEAMHY